METKKRKAKRVSKKPKYFRILSPDGFDIKMDEYKFTKEQVKTELSNFVKRYERQGYYSSVDYGRIKLEDIAIYCQIVPVD